MTTFAEHLRDFALLCTTVSRSKQSSDHTLTTDSSFAISCDRFLPKIITIATMKSSIILATLLSLAAAELQVVTITNTPCPSNPNLPIKTFTVTVNDVGITKTGTLNQYPSNFPYSNIYNQTDPPSAAFASNLFPAAPIRPPFLARRSKTQRARYAGLMSSPWLKLRLLA
jgi:hypothetical protein